MFKYSSFITQAFAVFAFSGHLNAAIIDASAFTGDYGFESFEGLQVGDNISAFAFYPGSLHPGIDGPYTFDSGITLTNPIPNSTGNSLVGVKEFLLGPEGFGLGFNGYIGDAGDVPFGSAFFYKNNQSDEATEFTFPNDVMLAGAYVSALHDEIITFSVFDVNDVLLETASIPSVGVADWGSNFIGIQHEGIRTIQISGAYSVIDGISFSPATLPIPSAFFLLCSAFLGLVGLERKRIGVQSTL